MAARTRKKARNKNGAAHLADEGGEFGVLEVLGEDADFEIARLEDAPGTAVGGPSHDVRELGIGEDGVHF